MQTLVIRQSRPIQPADESARYARTPSPVRLGNQAYLRRLQAKLRVGPADDPLEREADAAADQVMRMSDPRVSPSPVAPMLSRKCGACEDEERALHRVANRPGPQGASVAGDAAPPVVDQVLGSPGRALDPGTQAFMASRFGADFSRVRVHTDSQAAASAAAVGAQAYAVGHDVVFGAGQFDPSGDRGRRLLAHELAHVVQQGGARDTVRRAKLNIKPADFVGALDANDRRAAASCDVGCSGASIGTLHAMPLYFHTSRGLALPSNVGANGIGAAMHFIRSGGAIDAKSDCAACTNFRMIQIINSNVPDDSRNRQDFVDNNAGAKPYYDDVGAQGGGLHVIPDVVHSPDAGSQVDSTRSIYDTPYRKDDRLTALRPRPVWGPITLPGQDFWWNAETCVTCVKPGKDRVLGKCVTYGFRRAWNAGADQHDPAVGVGPSCNAGPSAAFVKTLQTDSSTSSYQFET